MGRRQEQRKLNLKRKKLEVRAKTRFKSRARAIRTVVVDSLLTYINLGTLPAKDFKPFRAGYAKDIDQLAVATIRVSKKHATSKFKKALGTAKTKALPTAKALALDYMDKQVKTNILNGIVKQQRLALTKILKEGLKAGKGVEDIAEAINTKMPKVELRRATTIARTETGKALNWGQERIGKEIGKSVGRDMYKIWTTSGGERTREDHAAVDGVKRRIDETFNVGGEALSRPGEGSPSQSINCRCTIVQTLRS